MRHVTAMAAAPRVAAWSWTYLKKKDKKINKDKKDKKKNKVKRKRRSKG